MQLNSPANWVGKAENEKVANFQTLVDDTAAEIGIKHSPTILFHCQVGIKDVAANRFVVGFIQYITAYRFHIEYEEGVVSFNVQAPISDGGCGGTIPAKFQGPAFLANPGYPWYQPPLLVKQAGRGRLDRYEFYDLEVNDAPAFHIPWCQNAARRPGQNHLRKLDRHHKFEMWYVVWDRQLAQIAQRLFRFRWEHNANITFDHTKPVGHPDRLTVIECSNTLTDRTVQSMDPIPGNVLHAPCANDHFRTNMTYRQSQGLPQHTLPPLALQVT